MNQTKLEPVVGAFVLAGLVAIAFFALKIGAGAFVGSDTYQVRARFTNISGLNPGGAVMISGVHVGRVATIELDPTFAAIATLEIRSDIKLPTDTIASVKSSGLIGDKYLALAPGGDTENLKPGDTITDTESSVDLESLISRFAFGNVKTDSPAPSTP